MNDEFPIIIIKRALYLRFTTSHSSWIKFYCY